MGRGKGRKNGTQEGRKGEVGRWEGMVVVEGKVGRRGKL